MKALLTAFCVMALPTAALADEVCYQLSSDGKSWSKTPELLCVAQVKDSSHTLTIKSGLGGMEQEVMTMRLSLASRAKCLDCNRDVFAVTNPSNSVANALQVTFNGHRDIKTASEKGTVSIGKTQLHYRRAAQQAAAKQ